MITKKINEIRWKNPKVYAHAYGILVSNKEHIVEQ
jgi:hypothetical protein